MIGLFKRLIAWLLEKIAARIHEQPEGQQEGYFATGEETLQGEIRRLLLSGAQKLRYKKEIDPTEERKNFFRRCYEKLIRVKDRLLAVPRWVKLIVITTVPICCIYIIFYIFLVNPADINREDEFRFSKGKPLVRIGFVKEWPTSRVVTSLISEAIDANLNVDITTKPISQNYLPDLWQMMVTNRVDITPSIWLPNTHAAFVADAGSKISDLGIWLSGARLGLIVPEYMQINSIDELTKKNSGGIIYCIDPSSKLNYMTQRALELYGLKDFRIIAKSDKFMISRLEEAIKKHENIVVTGWTPHWIFGEWKLRILGDPLKVYGNPENIHIFATASFKNNFPDICAFLSNIHLNIQDFSDLLASSRRLNSPGAAASKWLGINRTSVLEWDKAEK